MAQYDGYDVNDGGMIVSPGKFEGQPRYAVWFWEAYLDGRAEIDDGETMSFDVDDSDVKRFPELKEYLGAAVSLREDDQGFVTCEITTGPDQCAKCGRRFTAKRHYKLAYCAACRETR